MGKQTCEVLAVEPERLISYAFAVCTLNTSITWRLLPEGTGTRLTLRHEGFDLATPMGRQCFEGMTAGWPSVLKSMAKVLDAGVEHTALPS